MHVFPCRCSRGLHPTVFDIDLCFGYNVTMNVKDKIDLLVKRAELIYKNCLSFLLLQVEVGYMVSVIPKMQS